VFVVATMSFIIGEFGNFIHTRQTFGSFPFSSHSIFIAAVAVHRTFSDTFVQLIKLITSGKVHNQCHIFI